MPKPTIILSQNAREAAEMFSTPAALELQAYKEVAAVLGRRCPLRTFHRRSMRFEIHFAHGDEEFVVSARDAGLTCVGITNSYPREELSEADAVIASLAELTPPFIRTLR